MPDGGGGASFRRAFSALASGPWVAVGARSGSGSGSAEAGLHARGRSTDPTFVRYELRGVGLGPVLAVETERVTSPFLLCASVPTAVRIAGRVFVFALSGACATGAAGWTVYELDGGALRYVFAGFELAD
jgi:hypothetical protein